MTLLFKMNMSLLSETSLLTVIFYSINDFLSEWPNLLEDELTCNPTTHMSIYRHIDGSNNDDYTTYLVYNKERALTYCTLVLASTI